MDSTSGEHDDSGNTLSEMRKVYQGKVLNFSIENLVAKEPFAQFKEWFKEACDAKDIQEPNAMAIATATRDGRPSVRMVLLKEFNSAGFLFYTSYNGRKGRELLENPHASILFYWFTQIKDTCVRQVRIEGTVVKNTEEESEKYFNVRPRASQISAIVSDQSQPIESREVLLDRFNKVADKYSEPSVPIPKPDHWGGFVLKPEVFEFWQGQTNRLHNRIVFRRPDPNETINPEMTHIGEDGWVFETLCP